MTPKQRANKLRLMNPQNQQRALEKAAIEAAADPTNTEKAAYLAACQQIAANRPRTTTRKETH